MLKSLGNCLTGMRSLFALCAVLGAVAGAHAGQVPTVTITAPNGAQSTMVGSIHNGVGGLAQPDPSIWTGIRRYVIEHASQPVDNQTLSEPAPWARSLSPQELETYLSRAECIPMPENITSSATDEHLRLAKRKFALEFLNRVSDQQATQIAYLACEYRSEVSRDDLLLSEAAARKLPISYLEQDAEIEKLRQRSSNKDMEKAFRRALATNPRGLLDSLRDALNAGDYEAIRTISLEPFDDAKARLSYEQTMIDGRNKAWLLRLRPLLNDGGALIVVGAGHLAGENGLMTLLRNDGYRVETTLIPARTPESK